MSSTIRPVHVLSKLCDIHYIQSHNRTFNNFTIIPAPHTIIILETFENNIRHCRTFLNKFPILNYLGGNPHTWLFYRPKNQTHHQASTSEKVIIFFFLAIRLLTWINHLSYCMNVLLRPLLLIIRRDEMHVWVILMCINPYETMCCLAY